MRNCPGCLKERHSTYCPGCRKRLFGGKKVSYVLPFSRPVYEEARLAATGDRLSISGIQTKMPLVLREGRLELTEKGGQYILKPIPHGAFQRLESVPINENLTMQIARQVFGIRVAENGLVEFDDGERPISFGGLTSSKTVHGICKRILPRSPGGPRNRMGRITSTITPTKTLAN